MAIDIIQPLPGRPIGVGWLIVLQTDFVGPVLIPQWRVRVFNEDENGPFIDQIVNAATNGGWFTAFTLDAGGTGDVPLASSQLVQGENALVTVDFIGSSGVIETVTQTNTFDALQGAMHVVSTKVDQVQSLISLLFGVTGSQSTLSQNILDAVTRKFPVTDQAGLFQEIPIGNLPLSPPENFMIKATGFELDGSGSLERPPASGHVNAYGFTFTLVTVPAGMGKRNGPAIEYEQRLAQFTTIREDAGSDLYVAQVFNCFDEGRFYLFGVPNPTRLDYQIAPGVVVFFQWLILPLGS